MEKLWNKFEDHLFNEQLTAKRRSKLKTMYNFVCRNLDIPLEKATRKDFEVFINNVNRDIIKKKDGGILSGSTKADIKKFLRQFFKWYKGDNEFYPKEVSWIKSRIGKDEKPKEKPIITVKQVAELSSKMKKKPIFGYLTLLLFDSGFRIAEAMSIRKKDVTWEALDDNNKCFWVGCNSSKTQLRKVPIPLFTEDIKEFMNTTYVISLSDDDLLFNVSYNVYRANLGYWTKKLFNKTLSPHALRHSSATYYKDQPGIDEFSMCDRYGWSYGSAQAKTYCRRSNKRHMHLAKTVYNSKISDIQEENKELKIQMKSLSDKMDEIKKAMMLINMKSN